MDPADDLKFVVEKLREAMTRLGTLPGDNAIPGLAEKLGPITSQIEALQSQLPPEPPPEAETKRAPMITPATLPVPDRAQIVQESGSLLASFAGKHSPSTADMQALVDSLFETPSGLDEDRLSEDPGSISRAWDETDAADAMPPGSTPPSRPDAPKAPRDPRKKARGSEIWDDLSQAEE